jgi:hypothetical protein
MTASAVALLLKAALIQVSDYRLLGASGFIMVNSVIQLDLLFKQFEIKLCDISPFSSKISFT